MLKFFLYPYYSMLISGAWSIAQNLSGLGMHQSILLPMPGATSALTPTEVALACFLVLFIYAIFLSLLLFLAGYVLQRKIGLMSIAILLILPGLLGICDIWPSTGWVSENFTIDGTGILGAPFGTVSLLLFGLLSGWAITILIVDIFTFKDGFWHAYDHVWCVAAILAGIFFVADAEMNQHRRELDQTIEKISQTSSYLLRQVELYDAWCLKNGDAASASCKWANAVQFRLYDYAYSSATSFLPGLAPKSTAQMFGDGTSPASLEEICKIRTEIAAYNRLQCPVIDLGHGRLRYSITTSCKPTPIAVAEAFPEYLDGEKNSYAPNIPLALASELLVPNIIRLSVIYDKLIAKEQVCLRDKQYRWLYYIFFSIVIGGKVANATAKLTKMSERTGEETRRCLYLFRRIIMLERQTRVFILRSICKLTSWLIGKVRRLFLKLE